MKRALALLIALLLVCLCCSCLYSDGPNVIESSNLDLAGVDLEGSVTDPIITDPETEPEPEPDTTVEITTAETTTEAVTTEAPKEPISLNKKKIMFIGNSYSYWGNLVSSKYSGQAGDQGYFYQVAKSFGDNVVVTNFTFPNYNLSHAERGAYEKMIADHPNYYNNPDGKPVDSFYKQNYVILQQTGSNQGSTYSDAKKIIALFRPRRISVIMCIQTRLRKITAATWERQICSKRGRM